MQHLHPGRSEGGCGSSDRLVEPACALGSPGHQQRRPVRVEPEELATLSPQCRAVERADHPADRQADVARVPQRGVREARGDLVGEPGTELVGDAGQRVALVHDQGQPPLARREVRRDGDVSAEPDHHVGLEPVDHLERGVPGCPHPARRAQQVGVRAAGQRDRRDQLEGVPRFRDHPRLQPARRAESGDLDVRHGSAQGIGGGEQRRGVAGGPAAGQQDPSRRRRTVHQPRLERALPAEIAPGNALAGSLPPRRLRLRSAAAASGSARAKPTSRPRATSEGTSADPP